jgi:hypothetical protein
MQQIFGYWRRVGPVKEPASCNLPPPDTTLTPPGTQYDATACKRGKRNWLRCAGFATACKSLQRMTYHS